MSADFTPRWASPPGSTIAAALLERGTSPDDLAQALQISPHLLDQLLNGSLRITVEFAAHLSSIVGASPRFWLTRDAEYLADCSRIETAEWAERLPVPQMVEFGWIGEVKDWKSRTQACLDFFGVREYADWSERYASQAPLVQYKRTPTFANDRDSTLVWFRAAELQAEKLDRVGSFRPELLRASIPEIRGLSRFGDPSVFIPKLQQIAARAGLLVVITPAPSGCRASGATRWLEGTPLVQLSGRHLTDDHLWFTLLHELGHVINSGDERRAIVDGEGGEDDPLEVAADAFANESLFQGYQFSSVLDARQVVRLAKSLDVSPGLVVGQLQRAGLVPQNRLNRLKRRFAWDRDTLISKSAPESG